jgi:hypothetical protein
MSFLERRKKKEERRKKKEERRKKKIKPAACNKTLAPLVDNRAYRWRDCSSYLQIQINRTNKHALK